MEYIPNTRNSEFPMKKTFFTLLFLLCTFFTVSPALAASWDGATLSGDGEYTADIDNGATAIGISPSGSGLTMLGNMTTTGIVTHSDNTQALYFGKNDGGTLSGGTNSWGAFDGRHNTHTYFAGDSKTTISGSFNLGYESTAYVYIQDDAVLNVGGSFYLNQNTGVTPPPGRNRRTDRRNGQPHYHRHCRADRPLARLFRQSFEV